MRAFLRLEQRFQLAERIAADMRHVLHRTAPDADARPTAARTPDLWRGASARARTSRGLVAAPPDRQHQSDARTTPPSAPASIGGIAISRATRSLISIWLRHPREAVAASERILGQQGFEDRRAHGSAPAIAERSD